MELLNLKDILQKLTADREKMIEENDKVLVEVLCCHNSCVYVVVIVVVSFSAAVIFVVVVVSVCCCHDCYLFISSFLFDADQTRLGSICFGKDISCS